MLILNDMSTERTIRNCAVKFKTKCPQTWDALESSPSPEARWCSVCQRDVYFCASDEETLKHAEQGHCIAREYPHHSTLPKIVIGQPEIVEEPTPEQLEAAALSIHERKIDRALRNIGITARRCAGCGYPFPSWQSRCGVCGGEECREA